ncbi:uncharacterized protein LOC131640753 [Vicia villosa]|uniref:uncharacterized protein LOC131640753 n=1 Tax=Vicia villosa TaxID=3911 RepID=UPI00273CC9A6|nr:uncharacterized protein LOC131640753 [Vicia villosa]
MADGWTDRCRRTRINFLVYFPKGTVFIKSVDASGASKTAETLFKLFKEVVLYVGQENVVQVVTDNAANYVAAGKLLEREFPKLFWSPCAAHCINLMLQDMGKLEKVSETMSQASKITKYIYNHYFALYLMRQHTGGREILRPAPTRFATNFISLQLKITEPLVRVLRIVDSEDKPAMGYLYRAMYKAREEIEKRFRRNKLKVEPYFKILDNRWDAQLRKNLHAAGYWLNPSCRFGLEYEKNKSTTQGLLDVIEKYAYDSSFGRTTTVENRDEVLPDQWWDTYGTEALNLQKLAIRILNQTTKKKQNYDPINFETFGDHSNWDSPPFLTIEEMEALRKDLASMTIQPISNDIDELNLDEVDVEGDAPLNSGENNQSNDIIDGEDVANAIDFVGDGFDIEGDPNIEIILPPWN